MSVHIVTADAEWDMGAVDLSGYQTRDEKGQPEGYASLDVDGHVPADQLPPFDPGGGGGAGSEQITADIAVADGTTNNTTYLTGLLALAIADGVALRIPRAAANWVIQEWTIPSGAIIDARGATFGLPSGVQKRLLMNTSITLGTPGSVRDKNITIIGGTWDHGNLLGITGPDAQTLMFGFLDGLTIRNITVRSSGAASVGGQYAVYGWNVTNFDVDGIDANPSVTSAAIQFTQCSRGKIKRITGVTGDDSVALLPRDVVTLEFLAQTTMGDTHDIEVDGVYVTSSRNAVKVLAGTQGATILKARNITIRNVDSTAGNTGLTSTVYIGGDANPAYELANGRIENILVENVTQRLANTPAVRLRNSGTFVDNITLRRCRTLSGTTESIDIDTGSVGLITIADTYFPMTGSGYPIKVASGVVCRKMVVSNCRMLGPTTGTPTIALVQLATGSFVTTLVVDNCSSDGKAFSVAEIGCAVALVCRGIAGESSNHQGYLRLISGAAVTVLEASMSAGAVDDITMVAGSIKSQSLGFRCDVNSLQRSANSMVWNTNVARSCGVGPVVCDGTTWTHLITGFTF